ncbi:hypothetical protein [Verrucomicrobium sp. BvORR034]|uniref:hypothetical protein n=1 Tax=Verrucomicrobium sp. BvORR034 TaxID=1396418 RepID=UPI000678C232|nr:hypothetical protein [Verrucomicrobium sp. BvORR034]
MTPMILRPDLIEALRKCAKPAPFRALKAMEIQEMAAPDANAGAADGNWLEPRDVGWGVIYGAAVGQALKEKLRPLVEHRGGRGLQGREGRTVVEYLGHYRTGWGAAVDPDHFTYYLLLVGAPSDDLDWDFQRGLAIQNAVGRLDFSTDPARPESINDADALEAYDRYVRSILRAESIAPDRAPRVGLFPVVEPRDAATALAREHFMLPLKLSLERARPVGKRRIEVVDVDPEETCQRDWHAFLQREDLSLYFSSSHGMEWSGNNPNLRYQGALVMRDGSAIRHAPPLKDVKKAPAGLFTGLEKDVSLEGRGLICFACHSGGSQKSGSDTGGLFAEFCSSAHHNQTSLLVKRLLSHGGGAATFVVAHVNSAFSFSFQTLEGRDFASHFKALISRLMRGWPVGPSFEASMIPWRHATLQQYQEAFPYKDLAGHPFQEEFPWRAFARFDAENYMIFGDPAARLSALQTVESLAA